VLFWLLLVLSETTFVGDKSEVDNGDSKDDEEWEEEEEEKDDEEADDEADVVVVLRREILDEVRGWGPLGAVCSDNEPETTMYAKSGTSPCTQTTSPK